MLRDPCIKLNYKNVIKHFFAKQIDLNEVLLTQRCHTDKNTSLYTCLRYHSLQ